MEEKTFLEILREYFASKSDNEILVGDKRNIVIPMEWIFTEKNRSRSNTKSYGTSFEAT